MPADADLVTITAGGNDLQFAGSMLWAAWSRFQPGGQMVAMLAQGLADGIPRPTITNVNAVAEGLGRVVTGIRERAGNARVVLVDYLTIIDGREHGEDWPFSPAETAAFLRIQDALIEGYRRAAARTGAEILLASALSGDHGLGSPDPWVFDFQRTPERTAASFHPNAAGMAAVADALADLVEA